MAHIRLKKNASIEKTHPFREKPNWNEFYKLDDFGL